MAEDPKEHAKYRPLYDFLARIAGEGNKCHLMAFNRINQLLGDAGCSQLPVSAYTRREWWANDYPHHVQCAAWVLAGWRVENVDLPRQIVTFKTIV